MTSAQTRFIYKIAGCLNQSKKDYLNRVIAFNELEDIKGSDTLFKPVALVDIEATMVHSEKYFKYLDILFDIEKFRKTELYDAMLWTESKVNYNGITAFEFGKWQMVGYVKDINCSVQYELIDHSGIYLRDDDRNKLFIFIKLEEYLKR